MYFSHRFGLMLIAITILVSPTPLLAQDWFDVEIIDVGRERLWGTALVDWDGDGNTDILAATRRSVQLFLQESTFPLTFDSTMILYDSSPDPYIAADDIDQDGDMDFVANGTNNSYAISIYFQEEDSLREVQLKENYFDWPSVVIADINGDGNLDVVATATSHDPTWWEQLEDGSFEEHIILSGSYRSKSNLEVVDLDNDADLDIVFMQNYGDYHELYWLEQIDEDSWVENVIWNEGELDWGLDVVDIDLDGDLDILLCLNERLTLLENDGDRVFSSILLSDEGEIIKDLESFDADNDGDVDIVSSGGNVTYWKNNGNYNFIADQVLELEQSGIEIELADMDGDGSLDAVVSEGNNLDYSRLIVLLNEPAFFNENFNKVAPPDFSFIFDDTVSVSWVIPDEFNNATFTVRWSTTPDFDGQETQSAETQENFYDVTGLPDHSRIYWDVSAVDGDGSPYFSNGTIVPWSFFVDTGIAEVPTEFGIISPEQGSEVSPNLIAFIWEATSDPDPEDLITYELWISQNEDLAAPWLASEISGADRAFVRDLPELETLYWTVHARDTNTEGTWANDTLSFSTRALEISGRIKSDASLPTAFEIHSVSPNPFNPTTTITYDLPDAATITLKVYDLLGHEVAVLADGNFNAGRHQVLLDGSRLGSGIYFVEMKTEYHRSTKKLVLIK